MNWTLKFLPEAQKDFEQLAGNQKLLVAKALDKVVQNPVSIIIDFDQSIGGSR